MLGGGGGQPTYGKFHMFRRVFFLKASISFHNCSSPYITDKKGLWCKEKFEATSDEIGMNWKFCNSRMDNDQCYPSCQYTEYTYISKFF